MGYRRAQFARASASAVVRALEYPRVHVSTTYHCLLDPLHTKAPDLCYRTLTLFDRAAKRLDPLLPVEKALAAIETGVDRLAKLVEKKGGLKAKRMSQLIAPLKALPAGEGLGAASSLRYLGDLRLGVNKGVAVALKLVMSAGPCNPPPERLVVVDAQGDCAVLSLYSITKDACEKIASKDILVVKEPALRTISLSDGGDKSRSCPASYPCIQADPAEMLINGQSMLGSFAAPVVRLVNFDK